MAGPALAGGRDCTVRKAILDGGICLANAKANNLLGWSPSYPSYRQGVAEMVGPAEDRQSAQ